MGKIVKDSKIYILIFSLSLLFFLNPYLEKSEKLLLDSRYKGAEGMTQNTLLLRTLGMKKVGRAFIWIDQVLTVGNGGEVGETINKIKSNSEKMSFLDPYFVTNFNFSGSILGLIKIYQRFDIASEIYQRGIFYNPKNKILKNYYAGMVAGSRGNVDELLVNFEKVVNETRDDLLTNMVAYLYEKRYKEKNNKEDLEKAMKYWTLLIESKDERYREIGERKLEKYFKQKKEI